MPEFEVDEVGPAATSKVSANAAAFAANKGKSTACFHLPGDDDEGDALSDDFRNVNSNASSNHVPETVHLRKKSKESRGSSSSKEGSEEAARLRRISKQSGGSATEFKNKFGRQPSQVLEDVQQNVDICAKHSRISMRQNKTAFGLAQTMPAIVLMNNGRFDDLCASDIEDLFVVIDSDCNGLLDFGEIRMLLKEVLSPPCTDEQIDAIYALTDQNLDGTVTSEELLKALREGPLKDHMKRLQKENKARIKLEEMLGMSAEIDRELMLEKLKWIVGRDDAFRTLPFSLIYLCIFIYLVVAHLRIWDRQQTETGLQDWVHGYGGGPVYGPFLESVSDVPGMWGWLEVSGLQAVLGQCRNSTAGVPRCKVGTRYELLSDMQLKQTHSDGSEISSWLLSSNATRTQMHLHRQPMDYLGAAKLALRNLQSEWSGQLGVTDMQLMYSTYSEQSQLFVTNNVAVHFTEYGQALPDVYSTAVIINPYPLELPWQIACFTINALYVLCLLFPMYSELKDLIRGMQISGVLDGFVSYWGLWNGVDWVSITTGVGNITIWLLCCKAMSDDSIHDLLIEQDLQLLLTPRAMMLEVHTLESLQLAFDRIISLFFVLHLCMGLTGVAIMLKFFKAFQANPRLQLVTDTLVKAANDIFHFGVVFMLVFLGFAVTGHILLGSDLAAFRSFGASVDTAFVALMGEFGWYAEISKKDEPLGSGLPRLVMMIWFWSYMVFVLLIMINMLLAIVLEHYTELRQHVVNSTDAPSLWLQLIRYFEQAKRSRGFIPNTALVHLLDDDDTPCHTDTHVSQESLLRAFPRMQLEQARWLMKWLRGEAIDRMRTKDDQVVARLKILEGFVEDIANDLHVVNLNVAICSSKVEENAAAGHFGGDSSGSAYIDSGLADQLAEQVDRLTLTVGGAVRNLAAQIQGATETLSRQSATLRPVLRPAPPTFSPEASAPVSRRGSLEEEVAKDLAKAARAKAIQKMRTTPQQVPICFQSEDTVELK